LGEFHAWLGVNIDPLGRKLEPAEVIQRVVGGPLDPQPYLSYLREKNAAL
jgi:Zn-dependent M32 family carboxypeptidase